MMELVMFFITAAIAVIGGVAMVVVRNAVHSALFLLLNFGAIAVLFLLLQSPFLFAIQLTVYAGAIMVLFLFVVMLLGAEQVEASTDKLEWQRPLASVLALILLGEAIIIGFAASTGALPSQEEAGVALIADPAALGAELFTTYLLPFELTGVLLLVGIVGVVVLQQRSREAESEASAELKQAESTPPEQPTAEREPELVAAAGTE